MRVRFTRSSGALPHAPCSTHPGRQSCNARAVAGHCRVVPPVPARGAACSERSARAAAWLEAAPREASASRHRLYTSANPVIVTASTNLGGLHGRRHTRYTADDRDDAFSRAAEAGRQEGREEEKEGRQEGRAEEGQEGRQEICGQEIRQEGGQESRQESCQEGRQEEKEGQ